MIVSQHRTMASCNTQVESFVQALAQQCDMPTTLFVLIDKKRSRLRSSHNAVHERGIWLLSVIYMKLNTQLK